MMMNNQKRFSGGRKKAAERQGQGLIEYLILVCLVAVSAIAIISVVGKNVREQYANISAALRNEKAVKVTVPSSDTYDIRGMDDFIEGARTER